MQKNNDLNFKRVLLIEKLTKIKHEKISILKVISLIDTLITCENICGIPKEFFGNNNKN